MWVFVFVYKHFIQILKHDGCTWSNLDGHTYLPAICRGAEVIISEFVGVGVYM